MALYGRDAECDAIDRLLAGVQAGASASLVLTGEAGVGKSALLAHAVRAAAGRMRVLHAEGIRAEGDLPFAALTQLLGSVPLGSAELSAPQHEALRAALALGEAPAAGLDRLATGLGVMNLLSAVAGERPVLVVVDDAQWVDAASRDALVFAARRLQRDSVGFLFAYRDDDDRTRPPDLPRLPLSGLDVAAAARLLADRGIRMRRAEAERLVELVQGNPLAMTDLTAEDVRRLTRPDRGPEPPPIGSVLEGAYRERIDRLPPGTRRALLVAALLKEDDGQVLHAALARDGLALAALGPAEDARLVTLSSGTAEFRHPLIRSAVAQLARASDRRAAHRVIAAALAEEPGLTAREQRAWHLAAASYGPAEDIAAALEECAQRAVGISGYASAAAAYERAAQLSVQRDKQATRLLGAASAAFHAGQTARAATLLDRIRTFPPGQEDVRCEAEALRGRLQSRRGDPLSAYTGLMAEAHRLREQRPDLALMLSANATSAAVFAGRGGDALASARQAAELGGTIGGPYALYSRCMLGGVLALLGEPGGERLLDEAFALLPLDDLPPRILPLMGDIAFAYVLFERFEEAQRIHRLLARAATRRAAAGLMIWPVGEQALVDYRLGRWQAAYAGALEAERLALDCGLDNETANNRQLLGWITASRGRAAECRRYVDQVLEQAASSGARVFDLLACCVLGHLEMGLGHAEQAAEVLERAREMAAAFRFGNLTHYQWAPELAEAYARRGRGSDAQPIVDLLAAAGERSGKPLVLALSQRCRGLLSDDFEEHFRLALELHERAERPFETARTQLCFGERLRRRRKRSQAREQLQAAWRTFSTLEADCWTERARAELEATGVKVSPRAVTGADLLTPQEVQVALQVAAGASNREAAERLFISVKTVEYHLSHVYRKLGIASRAGLGVALAHD